MSQTWNLPLVGSTDTPATMYPKVNDGMEALRTLHSGATAPSSTVAYMLWADTTTNTLKIRNAADSGWITLFDDITAAGGGLLRAGAAAATANLDMNGSGGPHKIVNLANGTAAADAVNKSQVDAAPLVAVIDLGNITATSTIHIFKGAGVDIVDVALITGTSVATNASNYWEAQVRNATQANDLLADVKSTETGATNGEAITADAWWEFGVDQNNTALAGDDVIDLVITKNGSAADLTNVKLAITYGTNV